MYIRWNRLSASGDAIPIKAAKPTTLNIVGIETVLQPDDPIYTHHHVQPRAINTIITLTATVTMSASNAVSGLHSTGLLGAMIQGQRAEAACRSPPSSPASTVPPSRSSAATDREIRSQRIRDAARERISDFVMLDSLVAGNRVMTQSRNAAPTRPRDAEQESVYSTSSYASTRGLLKKTLSGWRQ